MKKILIVDDEFPLLRNISNYFCSFPQEFEVYRAQNAEDGLDIIKSESLDLVVTDIRLPKLDGLSLLKMALEFDKNLIVIVMTAFSSPDLRQSVLRKGALRFMEKPIDLQKLLSMVRELLQERDGWSGTMAGLDIFDFIQIMVLCQKSKALKCQNGEHLGHLTFYKGEMVHASTTRYEGKRAFLEIATWTGGEIKELPLSSVRKFERNINESATFLMMEAARLRDEGSRQPNLVPSSKQHSKSTKRELVMAVKDHFKELTEIEGFQGAAVFTERGEILESITVKKLDIKAIGMYANNALLNAQKATDKMGVGRGNMLQIRAPKAVIILRCHNEATDFAATKEGKVHIHCAVVMDPDGNSGMALFVLDKIVSKIANDLR